jgi:CheY-like chemotaxis protein
VARVLLVDDDDLVRRTLRFSLERWHDVVEAPEGRSALAAMRGQAVDVAILDLHMPGWTGVQTAAAIVSTQPGTKIILITGSSEADELQAAGVAVLRKPLRAVELLAAIDTALSEAPANGL